MAQAELQDYQVNFQVVSGGFNIASGKTKVFMKGVQLVTLESLRLDRMNLAATKIQRAVRRFLWKQERKRAAIVIQKHWKAFSLPLLWLFLYWVGRLSASSLRLDRMNLAASKIQRAVRLFLWKQERKRAAIVIQSTGE
ncbi:unnamed protein product, partial [Closterium sp. Naga37s-1]